MHFPSMILEDFKPKRVQEWGLLGLVNWNSCQILNRWTMVICYRSDLTGFLTYHFFVVFVSSQPQGSTTLNKLPKSFFVALLCFYRLFLTTEGDALLLTDLTGRAQSLTRKLYLVSLKAARRLFIHCSLPYNQLSCW